MKSTADNCTMAEDPPTSVREGDVYRWVELNASDNGVDACKALCCNEPDGACVVATYNHGECPSGYAVCCGLKKVKLAPIVSPYNPEKVRTIYNVNAPVTPTPAPPTQPPTAPLPPPNIYVTDVAPGLTLTGCVPGSTWVLGGVVITTEAALCPAM